MNVFKFLIGGKLSKAFVEISQLKNHKLNLLKICCAWERLLSAEETLENLDLNKMKKLHVFLFTQTN